MGIFSKLFGGSHEEEIPVLKSSEHYPVDEAGDETGDIRLSDIIVDDGTQRTVHFCTKCGAVYSGHHSC